MSSEAGEDNPLQSKLSSSQPRRSFEQHKRENRERIQRHWNDELSDEDHETILKAQRLGRMTATLVQGIGLGCGLLAAHRLRINRANVFRSLRKSEQPSHMVFPSGRTERMPDVSALQKPFSLGNVAIYLSFGFLGLSMSTGTANGAASHGVMETLTEKPGLPERAEQSFRNLYASILRKDADSIDEGHGDIFLKIVGLIPVQESGKKKLKEKKSEKLSDTVD